MRLADALATALMQWDVRYVFGVSGSNIEPLHDAISRIGRDRLVSVLARSEMGAAFMADARARTHKTLGVCCSSSGGGMMSLAAGIAESFAESVPVLAIVGQPPRFLEGRGAFQDSSGIGRSVDARGLFGAIAKHVWRIEDARDVRHFWLRLAEAGRAALSGRPGPSVVLVPRDLHDCEVGPMPADFPRDLFELRPRAPVPEEEVSRLFEAIRAAERPVLLAGSGLSRCSAPSWLLTFARAGGIPVVTTMGDPGAFPNDDPLWLGMVGAAGHASAHRYLVEEADLIVAVGAGLNVMTRRPIQAALARCQVAVVNIDAGEVRRSVDSDLVVEADAGEVFRRLCSRWAAAPFFHQAPRGFRPAHSLPVPPRGASGADDGALLQVQAMRLLEPFLPRTGHLLFEAGSCAAAALHCLPIPSGTSSTVALGMGGTGWAIAGAVGALIGGDRDQCGMVLCDDNAFLAAGLEVHTAACLGLPILFVVFNQRKNGICVNRQRRDLDGWTECAEHDALDVASLCRGFGRPEQVWMGRASTPAELRQRLDEYRNAGPRAGVLELVLTGEEMPLFAELLDEVELDARQPPHRVSPGAATLRAVAG